MKFNWLDWGFVAIVVSLLIVVISWGVSVEIRMTQHASIDRVQESVDTVASRIQNIEKLLLPVIVDYKVRKELEDRAAKTTTSIFSESPVNPAPAPSIRSVKPVKPTTAKKPDDVEHRAQKWAEQEILRGQQINKD